MKKKSKWLVTVGSKGRIVIPIELRKRYNLEPITQFLLVVNEQNNIELRKLD